MCVSETEDTINCKSTNHKMENKHKSLDFVFVKLTQNKLNVDVIYTVISHFSANRMMAMEIIHKHENKARGYITVKVSTCTFQTCNLKCQTAEDNTIPLPHRYTCSNSLPATCTYSVNDADNFPSSMVIVYSSRVLCGGIKCILLRLLFV
jgi:hypothetical protein